LSGRIYTLEDYGALVKLEKGGVGVIPARELSWDRISRPDEVVSVGERVTIEVLSVDVQKTELILSKLDGDETHVARLAFAGEAFTSPLTKGMLRPFGIPSAKTDSSPSQAMGHSQVLRKRALEEHPFTRYRPGMRLHGVVARVLDYGAFVEIANGGTGLVPIAEMSWEYVNHPSDVVREGDQVTVEVLSVDLSANRLSLSMRLPERHWINNYQTNSVVEGTVESIQDRGAVIRLQRGGTGWLHISELAWRRVNHPGEVVWEGQHIRVLVKSVDGNRKKIELSMKALQAKPVLKVGEIVWGRVSKIEQFGAFVDLGEYGSGLIHISQLSYGYVKHPSEIVREGDSVPVLVMETYPKIKLSLKQAQ
jgi:ribosomal protein S1